ncbi:MAG: amidohydrolase family protein [Bacteroidales bacterium]|nr:amidohydrolase family protein [Bacteroidales bacterium]
MRNSSIRLCGILFLVFFSSTFTAGAQVRVGSAPDPGFGERIASYVDSLRIVDSHEHLFSPFYVKHLRSLDFMILLNQFGYYDLISAGMSKTNFGPLMNQVMSPRDRWTIIEPHWQNSFNTSYNRIALLTARRLYRVDDINRNTVDTLSRRIIRNYQNQGWTNHVLKDLCRIDCIIQDGDQILTGVDNVVYVKRFTDWINIRTSSRIDTLARRQGLPASTLEEFVATMENELVIAIKSGIVAVKVNMAYQRTLRVENVNIDVARKVFRSLRNTAGPHALTWAEAKPLQDYMFLKLMEMARNFNIPVVIHTGLLSGNGNILENSNPLLLANIFMQFPDVKFGLFHGGYPFGGEIASLAKNFPNVFIDLNWMYAISPSYSIRYLNEWLETVPAGKIMAFGGDSQVAENVYGSLVFAREIITNVLISKVRDGYFTEKEAMQLARMMLRENAIKFYRLNLS